MKCGKQLKRGISHFALASAIALAGSAYTSASPTFVSQANAKNLFEIILEKHRERKRKIQERRRKKLEAAKPVDLPKAPAKPVVAVKKVSAPKYYTYKPTGFEPLNLGSLVAQLSPASAPVKNGALATELDQAALQNTNSHDGEVQLAAVEGDAAISQSDAQKPIEAGTASDRANADNLQHRQFIAAVSENDNVEGLDVKVEKGMGEAIVKHYSANPRFLWVDERGHANQAARDLMAVFADAGSVGLNPADYLVEDSMVLQGGKNLAKAGANTATPETGEGQSQEHAQQDQKNQAKDQAKDQAENQPMGGKEVTGSIETGSIETAPDNEEAAKEKTVASAEAGRFSIGAPGSDLNHSKLAAAASEKVNNDLAQAEAGKPTSAEMPEVDKSDANAKPANDIAIGQNSDPAKWKAALAFEMDMTARALRYMADSQNGIINPNRISGYHDFKNIAPDYDALLVRLSSTDNVGELMDDMQPKGPAFAALKAELARLSGDEDGFAVEFAPKTLIKPGQESAQLPKVVAAINHYGSDGLKEKHNAILSEYSGSTKYDKSLVNLVKSFQKESGLGPDGVIGSNTIAKLQGQSSPAKITRIKMAMERLRWQPDDLGTRHVFINQPAYTAKYMVDYKTKLGMRAIVGKRSNQTYFFNDEIETVVYNPYWGVPRSIIVNEMLPKLRANPSYLDNAGYEVTNARGQKVSSASINWNAVGSRPPYDVRQKPGAKNALGELKILFPNKHAIYMHDTPSRGLFERSKRALSHGCVRLQKPRDMAAAVLGKDVDYVSTKLGEGHGQENVPAKIPVYVSYFTAWPNDDGKMQYFSDIYGRDAALQKAIAATRKVRNEALHSAKS